MKYRLYTTSFQAWDAMLAAIRQAEKSIFIEMYIFLDDTGQSHDFFGVLRQKALEGVRVIVVADAYGSYALRRETLEALRSAGVTVLFFSNWLRHIHRKILVIDETSAFVGGVNIGRRFAHWNDLQIRVRGKIVGRILQSFAYTYEMAGGNDTTILSYRHKKFPGKLRDWFIEHWPLRNIYTLKDYYIENISQATKHVRIVTPYLTPPRWLISLLDGAVRRGVRVEIIIPKQADWVLLDRLNYRYAYNLSRIGVRFFLSKNMNHAKLLLIDDSVGLLGSQNVDLFSFHINAEAGIFSRDKHLLRELDRVVEKWKHHAIPFTPEHYRMQTLDYVILALMKLLRPIL